MSTQNQNATTPKLRVLLLNEFFYPENQGGTGTIAADVVARMRAQRNVEVTAITSRYAYRASSVRYKPYENWDGVEIHRIASPNWSREKPAKRFVGNLAFALGSAWKALFLPRPDVVLVTTAPLPLPIAARILKIVKRVPYAYVIYDLDPDRTVQLKVKEESSREVQMLFKWQHKWLHGADRVMAIGRCMRDHLIARYGLAPEKVAVVEVGGNPDVVRPGSKDTKFRREHGIQGTMILYSGNFGKYHDFDTILEAAAKLRDSHPNVTFVLVGGGAKKKYVEEYVASHDLTNVKVLPFVPEEELSDLLSSADVHIVTLEPGMEGLCVPSKFYTCLASGRPVFALMRAGTEVARVVEEAGVGARMDVGDVDALVQAVTAGGEDFENQGIRAREVFDRLYSADHIAIKTYDVLMDCAMPHKGRSANPQSTP